MCSPLPDTAGCPPGGSSPLAQLSPTATHSSADNFLSSDFRNLTQGVMRSPLAAGNKNVRNRSNKAYSKRKHDLDMSTNRLVNNFLARKPLLAERVHAHSSCINSPPGTEFISSGGS